jgi:hypothetical protein
MEARKQPHPRIGYAALGLALAVAVVGGRVFPHGAQWAVAAILLWAGVTVVGRGRGGRMKRRPVREASASIRPRASPLKPGETYQDSVKLTLVPNVPLADLWCQRLRQNGIEAFYKGASPFGGQGVGIADLNPGLPAEIWVGEDDAERARQLFPELR